MRLMRSEHQPEAKDPLAGWPPAWLPAGSLAGASEYLRAMRRLASPSTRDGVCGSYTGREGREEGSLGAGLPRFSRLRTLPLCSF